MLDEVFTSHILFDMTSTGGGEPANIEARAVCKMWSDRFEGLDAVHHQAGHYLINVSGDTADIFANAVATHYKANATRGHTRSFVGSYDLRAQRGSNGWRLSQFKYNLKYLGGNTTLA